MRGPFLGARRKVLYSAWGSIFGSPICGNYYIWRLPSRTEGLFWFWGFVLDALEWDKEAKRTRRIAIPRRLIQIRAAVSHLNRTSCLQP